MKKTLQDPSKFTQNPIFEILDGAIFIADAHFSPNDLKAFYLLEELLKNPPVQVFFMGDIFHLLIGSIPSSLKDHQTILKKINQLSQITQVFYFEGNHDFGIQQKTLPYTTIIKRKNQPMQFNYKNKTLLLAHGDIFISPLYEFYIQSITHPIILKSLFFLDCITFGKLYKIVQNKIMQKEIFALKNPKNFLSKRTNSYKNYVKKHSLSYTRILEGHFHCELENQNYKAIPSFFCQKKILRIINNDFEAFIA